MSEAKPAKIALCVLVGGILFAIAFPFAMDLITWGLVHWENYLGLK